MVVSRQRVNEIKNLLHDTDVKIFFPLHYISPYFSLKVQQIGLILCFLITFQGSWKSELYWKRFCLFPHVDATTLAVGYTRQYTRSLENSRQFYASVVPGTINFAKKTHSVFCFLALIILTELHSFIPQSALRQVRSLFQSEFSTECDLVLPLTSTRTCRFRKVIQ